MNGLTLDFDPVRRALLAEAARRRGAALETCRALAARLETHAKAAAPWRDRTGLARRSIAARAEASGGRVRIVLTGGAPYFAKLECALGGRYAALGPAVRAFAPEFLEQISKGGSA